ncbi:MAG: diacylglycerol kinase family lipid kinase [Acidobacteria bacterium]|nr:diacylglycerol kinase family lipid kinase [Acidobacteriota bacterium]
MTARMPPAKAGVIVNPHAGRGCGAQVWRRAEAGLRARFGALEAHFTAGAGDAATLARHLRRSGCDLLLVAGGDGTLNEVASGLLADGVPAADVCLAYIPAGNGSDFARALGSAAGPRPIDAVHVALRDGSERWFVNMASLGLGAEVVRRVRGRGAPGYLLSAAAALARTRAIPFRLTVDGAVLETRAVHVALGNGTSQGGGMCVCPRARPDDGLLDVTVIGDAGLADLLLNLRRIYSGSIYEHAKVRHLRGAVVRVEAESRLDLDGELAGWAPAEFRVVRGALTILGLDLA